MPRILIAEASNSSYPLDKYDVTIVTNGLDCLEKLNKSPPDLLIVSLHLPKMHGIELLKIAKKKKIGCILIDDFPLMQNYEIALKYGADEILAKPFKDDTLLSAIDHFFAGTLKPSPFSGPCSHPSPTPTLASLPAKRPASYLKLWGTRGSTPVSGPHHMRYGGHTASLEIRTPRALVLIDAGTGFQSLGKELLLEPPRHYHLFFSHTHWDHINGFPFFAPLFHTDATFDIWTPVGYTETARQIFTDIFSESVFPVPFDQIAPRLTFHELRDGDHIDIEDIHLQASYAYHPGSTLCFKISACGKNIGYVTDNEVLLGHTNDPTKIPSQHPLFDPHRPLIELLRHSDLLIHEAQYLDVEYVDRIGWGHSSVSNASLLAREIAPKEWVITHHNPRHSDDDLQKKLIAHEVTSKRIGLRCPIHLAADKMVIPL